MRNSRIGSSVYGVIGTIVDEYCAPLWTLGGFNSLSSDYYWSEDIKQLTGAGKRVVVAYFGDFDPSGICIEETSRARRDEFGVDCEWKRYGLTPEDFGEFSIARIPVKRTDRRAQRFLARYGDRAAELDALPPAALEQRIRMAIETHIDRERWDRVQLVEEEERAQLNAVIANWQKAAAAATADD